MESKIYGFLMTSHKRQQQRLCLHGQRFWANRQWCKKQQWSSGLYTHIYTNTHTHTHQWMVASVTTIADSSTMCCIFIVMESESKSNIKESAAMDIDHVSSRLRYVSDLCSMWHVFSGRSRH
jgi:hypothetical protein